MSELGNQLRNARIEKGYTLNTLQQKTKIQKKYLQAIEEGQFSQMPGQFYVRAFIKQYADMVGLNGDALLIEHEDELNATAPETLEKEEEEQILPSRSQKYNDTKQSQFDQIASYIPMVLLITLILFIIGTLIYAIMTLGQKDKQETVEEENTALVNKLEPESVSFENDTSQKEEDSSDESIDDNQIKVGEEVMTLMTEPSEETHYQLEGKASNYEFEVKAKSYVWVGLYENDVIQEDVAVNEGESIKYTPSDNANSVRIRLGYPEGGEIFVNGKKINIVSDYIKETVVFDVATSDEAMDETESTEEAMTLDIPSEEENNESTGFQGPEVYNTEEN